jgi:hypothetical protein
MKVGLASDRFGVKITQNRVRPNSDWFQKKFNHNRSENLDQTDGRLTDKSVGSDRSWQKLRNEEKMELQNLQMWEIGEMKSKQEKK